jgi:hypothetical protein
MIFLKALNFRCPVVMVSRTAEFNKIISSSTHDRPGKDEEVWLFF